MGELQDEDANVTVGEAGEEARDIAALVDAFCGRGECAW